MPSIQNTGNQNFLHFLQCLYLKKKKKNHFSNIQFENCNYLQFRRNSPTFRCMVKYQRLEKKKKNEIIQKSNLLTIIDLDDKFHSPSHWSEL